MRKMDDKVIIDTPYYKVYSKSGKLFGKEISSRDYDIDKINKIFIRSIKYFYDNPSEVLSKFPFNKKLSTISKILIKINMGGGVTGNTSTYTESEIIKSLIDYFGDTGIDIYLCEADMISRIITEKLLRKRGYKEILKSCKFINLSSVEKVRFFAFGVPHSISIPKIMLETNNFIISVCPLKNHWETGVSLTEKNMFGALSEWYKGIYHIHGHLDEVIAAAGRVMRPNLSIIGGSKVGIGLGPHICFPIPLNRLFIADNPFELDLYCSEVLGFPSRKLISANINKKLYEKWDVKQKYSLDKFTFPLSQKLSHLMKKYSIKPNWTYRFRWFLDHAHNPSPFQIYSAPILQFLLRSFNTLLINPIGYILSKRNRILTKK